MTQGERDVLYPVKLFILIDKAPVKIYKLNEMRKNLELQDATRAPAVLPGPGSHLKCSETLMEITLRTNGAHR